MRRSPAAGPARLPRLRRPLAVIAVAIAAAFISLVSPAWAQGAPPLGSAAPMPIAGGTALGPAHPVLDFRGSFTSSTAAPTVNPLALLPETCLSDCQEWSLEVATSKPVLVSVENANASIDDGLDLYVYDASGKLVASDNGIGANGQAIEIQKPLDGPYTIAVTITYAYNASVSYLGEARIMAPPSWKQQPTCGITVGGHKGCFYLPSLVALPASDLHVSGLLPLPSTPIGFPFPVSVPTPTSCYADETLGLDDPSVGGLEHPVLRCLRFTTQVNNLGSGPLEVRIRYASYSSESGPELGYLPGECYAEQLVYATNGSAYPRPAGSCQPYLLHAPPQLPYGNVVAFSLYQVQPSGALGRELGSAYKASYCLSDDVYFGFGTAGPNGPNQFTGEPGCNAPSEVDHSATAVTAWIHEGISPGWGDLYTWDTPDQFLNVTGLPAGRYAIVERVNPLGEMLATSPDPCSFTDVELTATSAKALSSGYLASCPPGSSGSSSSW